ncbi:hypothetical protein LIER_33182 [Lithospermum erythrorhizon]|uniref:Retrovirus-related Pol polyprotein from transposon TNT 1-94 n=1 Tax=Lithospermum erythrorhizon TaxID=34254 RepID=A0AAV3RY72_LITER
MNDLGEAKQILGMRIIKDRDSVRLKQEEYPKKVVKRFNMLDAKPGSYASAVGSLMYAMVCTRPDIAHAVGVVSRYMSNPGREHWEVVKWILRDLNGSAEKSLCFRKSSIWLIGYIDADNCGDVDSRKSTEYVAVAEVVKEMIWLQTFLKKLNLEHGCNTLYCDSQSAIYLVKNPVFHARTKHIGLRYHFICSVLENGVLKLDKILGDRNPDDMFTKVVNKEKLKLCSTSVNLQSE